MTCMTGNPSLIIQNTSVPDHKFITLKNVLSVLFAFNVWPSLNKESPNMSVKNYKKLYLRSKKSDVTLVIGDYELPAHRFILSERSEYFKTMFSSNFIEARSDKITLKETDLKTFESVLKYIYTGKFNQLHDAQKNRIHSDELFEILVCARFYMVDNLALEVISHIKKVRTAQNCK
uniref:BTB domain-containing protein n=1 Tax=Panagrellus redivivus TaxID=6233 RepID=A0A7E4UU07_PANRE